MIALPGADSYRVTGMPSRSNTDARRSAALRVSPGGFDVSMRTYCWRSRVASAPAAFQSGACADIARWATTKDTKDTKPKANQYFLCVGRVLCGESVFISTQTLPSREPCAPGPLSL